jgi:hypothetical protein
MGEVLAYHHYDEVAPNLKYGLALISFLVQENMNRHVRNDLYIKLMQGYLEEALVFP